MIFARQSTAIIVTVGPVLDANGAAVTDGVVADFKASKNGGAPAALNGSATLTHRHTGHYSLSLTTTDVNTVGSLEIVIDDTANACPMKEITVIEPAVYDALFADTAAGYGSAADIAAILADTDEIQQGWSNAYDMVNGVVYANVTFFVGSSSGIAGMSKAVNAIAYGVVDAGSSTTVINIKSLTPTASARKLNGRVLLFQNTTATANLRAQGSPISDMDATTITLATALTDTPAEDDIFVVQ